MKKLLFLTAIICSVNCYTQESEEKNETILPKTNLEIKPEVLAEEETKVEAISEIEVEITSETELEPGPNVGDSLKIVEIQNKLDELIKLVESDKDTSMHIGDIILKDKGIVDCIQDGNSTISIQIKNVFIEITDGIINDIIIYTEDGKLFTNSSAPISINRINKGNDKLFYSDGSHKYEVYVNKCIVFKKANSYLPENGTFDLIPSFPKKKLYKKTSISSLINVRLYSDVLGLLDEESNGIAQTELSLKMPIHRGNWPNSFFYTASNLSCIFQLSRFDEKYQSTNIETIDTTLSRINLNQRKWFSGEMRMNIFSGSIVRKTENKFSIDALTGFNVSRLGDFNDTTSYLLPYYGLKGSLSLKASENFGLNLSIDVFREMFPEKQSNKYGSTLGYFKPQLELYFHPYGNIGNIIFGRVNYTTLTATRGSYWNLQFGYNLSISELINSKKE